MRRALNFFFVGILTFTIGTTAVYLLGSQVMRSGNDQTQSNLQSRMDDVPTVPLCELARNSQLYDGQLVRVESVVYCSQPYYENARWFYIRGSDCGTENRADVRIELGPSFKPNFEVQGWLNEMQKIEGGINGKESHAVIVGRYDPGDATVICNFCIPPKLTVSDIEHVSAVTRIP